MGCSEIRDLILLSILLFFFKPVLFVGINPITLFFYLFIYLFWLFLHHVVVVVQSLSRVLFLWPYGLQHERLPYPSVFPGVCWSSCPLSRWCYLSISSSATLLSFCFQSFPASGSFPRVLLISSNFPFGPHGFTFGLLPSWGILSTHLTLNTFCLLMAPCWHSIRQSSLSIVFMFPTAHWVISWILK